MKVDMRYLYLSLGLLVHMTCGSVQANQFDFDQGVSAAEKGNYAEAFCIWKPLAEVGHAQAQYRLGWLYAKGLGLAISMDKALHWWQSAADLGHADAQFSIAWAHHHGEGVVTDMTKALDYYLQASRHGQTDAIEVLQELLMRGDKAVAEGVGNLLREQPDVLGDAAIVSVERANVRDAPNKHARLLLTLKEQGALRVLGEQGNWLRVWLVEQQRFGWIYNRLVNIL